MVSTWGGKGTGRSLMMKDDKDRRLVKASNCRDSFPKLPPGLLPPGIVRSPRGPEWSRLPRGASMLLGADTRLTGVVTGECDW